MINYQSLSSVSQGTMSVATAATRLFPSNNLRSYAILINYSTIDITIGLEATVSAINSGIVIPANGGYYEMSGKFGNNCRGVITAIANTTPTTINYLIAGGGD